MTDTRDQLEADRAWSAYRLANGVDPLALEAAHLAFLAGWDAKGRQGGQRG